MHEYNVQQTDDKFHFTVREEQTSEFKKSSAASLTKPLVEQFEKDQKKSSGIIDRAKGFIRTINKSVMPTEEEHTTQHILAWKKKFQGQIKTDRIYVRDYELEEPIKVALRNTQTGKYLEKDQWIDEVKFQDLRLYLRTEAWLETKESPLTAKNKLQVLTDMNFLLKGNPWVWVKRFDLEEE